ncbi:lipopolysaccharide biosynthesis protein [Rubrivivax albus]|nr:lipopolysaccharide biosynthesis protein [Rubrivivax albus]
MLRSDTAMYGGAVFIDRLLALLLLPLLTRAIGEADYGAWTQTLVVSSLLMPLVLFALPTTIVRSFAPAALARLRWLAFGRLGGVVLALFAVAALAGWAAREGVAELAWGDDGRAVLLPGLLLVLAADAGIEFANAWLRAAGRIGWIAWGLLARSALRYAVVWALVADGSRALQAWLPVYGVSQLALAAALLILAARVLQAEAQAPPAQPPAAEVPRMAELLSFSAPLVGLALFGALNASFDRFLLVQALGLEAVATYAAAVSLSAVPAVFYSVLGFTLFPVLARAWHGQRRDEAARLTGQALAVFVGLALPVGLALAVAGPWLLPWLTTASYQAPWPVFAGQAVAVLAFGIYQVLLYTLLLDGRSLQVLGMAMVAAALNAVANLWLLPRFGMSGAAAAAALANLAVMGWAWQAAGRVLGRVPAPWRWRSSLG